MQYINISFLVIIPVFSFFHKKRVEMCKYSFVSHKDNHITLMWISYHSRFLVHFGPYWLHFWKGKIILAGNCHHLETLFVERHIPPKTLGSVASYSGRIYLMFSKGVPDSSRTHSCPVPLAPARFDRIGFDPFVLDKSVFLLSLFNCGRFSRHGLSISGFSVSGQAVSDSSSRGWPVSGGWGVS